MSALPMIHEPNLPAIPQAENPIARFMEALIDKGGGATETAAAMEKLTELYIRMESEAARKAFAFAKCQLQAELPHVIAKRIIPNNDGGVRSSFASYQDIATVIEPFLTKHGFSISFTIRSESEGGKDRICAVCKLSHVSGHSETNEFAVRVSAPPKASDAQADGATRSYARRGALCDCLNIIVDSDNDARLEGGFISGQEASTLEARVNTSGMPVAAFLKIAGAQSFKEIREGKLSVLLNVLDLKEKMPKKPAPNTPASSTDAKQPSSGSVARGDGEAGGGEADPEPLPSTLPDAARKSPKWMHDEVIPRVKPETLTAVQARKIFAARIGPTSWAEHTEERQNEIYALLLNGEFAWA